MAGEPSAPWSPNASGPGGFQVWGNAPNGGGSKKTAPAGPDFMGLANQQAEAGTAATNAQTQANRPNQTNAFGGQVQWTQNPDGSWSQNQSFGGPLGGASSALQGQAAANMATPFDFGQFGQMQDGSAARDQAIQAAYGQATSRLDPRFQREEDALRTRLINQGLDPASEAAKGALGDFGQQKNDAYTSAMNSAVMQGQAAGDSVFRNNMASRQQAIVEALRQRGMPMQELLGMQGLLQQPGFMGAGRAETPNFLAAGGMQDAANFRNWNAEAQRNADAWGGGMDFLTSLIPFAF